MSASNIAQVGPAITRDSSTTFQASQRSGLFLVRPATFVIASPFCAESFQQYLTKETKSAVTRVQ
jgi:hypothetical protein